MKVTPKQATYAGIDYGLGQSNVDKTTGIRYGVISQHSVMPEAMDNVEYDYGKPTCPKCGNQVHEFTDDSDETWPNYSEHGCDDYVCPTCKHFLDSSEVFSEEALGWSYKREGYALTDCLDSDIFVLKSPYYTFAQFCSPCVPGAGNLDTPVDPETGAKCYALGHDWFEEGKAPYTVYSVETGEEVLPE